MSADREEGGKEFCLATSYFGDPRRDGRTPALTPKIMVLRKSDWMSVEGD